MTSNQSHRRVGGGGAVGFVSLHGVVVNIIIITVRHTRRQQRRRRRTLEAAAHPCPSARPSSTSPVFTRRPVIPAPHSVRRLLCSLVRRHRRHNRCHLPTPTIHETPSLVVRHTYNIVPY